MPVAIKMKPLDQSKAKWRNNSSNAQEAYASGAEAAGPEWQAKTIAAESTYQQAITSPGVPKRFAAGVRKAGAEKYTRRIRLLGASRYATGVAEGEDEWERGFAPYAAVIQGITLSARRPRGDPQTLRRVEEVSRKLNATRLAALGSSS